MEMVELSKGWRITRKARSLRGQRGQESWGRTETAFCQDLPQSV